MDDDTLAPTRRSLHAVAELVIAGPQFRILESIELRVRPNGIGGAVADIAIVGDELVGPTGRVALQGTCRTLAASLGLEVSDLSDVYRQGSGVDPDDELRSDPQAVELLLGWFTRADAALRRFQPDRTPVLWPEHFDVGITVDRVNYGASPGDASHPHPYAYVGPWDPDRLAAIRAADSAFWNVPFGAALPAAELNDVDAVVEFFHQGKQRAVG